MVHLFSFSVLVIFLPVKCFVDGHIYIKSFRLTHVPKEIPRNATKIYLNNNQLTDIESETFLENSQCINLRLNHNRIAQIRKDMWIGLLTLEYLSLEHSAIETVELSSFTELHKLKGLYLHNNKLTFLPDNILPLKQMPKIEILTLHDNKLKRDELGWLRKLCDSGHIHEYTVRGDDILCDEKSMDDDESPDVANSVSNGSQQQQQQPEANSNADSSKVPQLELSTQGEQTTVSQNIRVLPELYKGLHWEESN